MLFSRCARLISILFAAAPCLAAGPTLRLADVINVKGKPVVLRAEVSSSVTLSVHAGKANVPVTFFADGQSLGTATTNSKGFASLELPPTRVKADTFSAEAALKGRSLTSQGRWFNWDTEHTVIAVDIDDTVCHTNYGDLFLSNLDKVSKPLEGSADAMQHLSKNFYILYFSARPLWLTEKTRVWLEDNNFPAGPVVHKGGWESCLRQEAVKDQLLTELRPLLPNLLIGIADRDVDCRAFGSHDMVTMLVRNRQLADTNRRSIGFDGWPELDQYFTQHAAALAHAPSLSTSIAQDTFPPDLPKARTQFTSQRGLTEAIDQDTTVR